MQLYLLLFLVGLGAAQVSLRKEYISPVVNWVIRTQLDANRIPGCARVCTDFPHSLIAQKVSDFHILINLLYNYARHTPMIVSVTTPKPRHTRS